MAAYTDIKNMSTTAASNAPDGDVETVDGGDDHLRGMYALFRQNVSAGSDLTAASSVTIPSNYGAAGLTGTTTVAGFASTNSWTGRVFLIIHKASHTFTHSSTLVCPGGASKAFVNGDKSWWIDRDGAGTWECVAFLAATSQFAAVTGTTGVFSSTLDATGNFAVNTNKFNVTAASGNTTVAGTLGVTGVATFSASPVIGTFANPQITCVNNSGTASTFRAGAQSAQVFFGSTTDSTTNIQQNGNNNVVLTSASTTFANVPVIFSAQPKFGAHGSAAVTSTGGDFTTYTEDYDTGGIFNPTTGVCTVNATGEWLLVYNAQLTFDGGTSGSATFRVFVNGAELSTREGRHKFWASGTGGAYDVPGSATLNLTNGDAIKLNCALDSSLTTRSASINVFKMRYLG